MQRIVIVGPSGAGKTTLARALSVRLGIPHLELDSVFHQAGWTPIATPEFRARVGDVVRRDSWVVDGNYGERVQDLVLARADTVVWLRMPRRLVMRQVVWRTGTRLVSRKPLWNGNRESLRNVLSRDPERSIVVWAWRMHGKWDDTYEALQAVARPEQRWVVLRSRAEVDRFLRQT